MSKFENQDSLHQLIMEQMSTESLEKLLLEDFYAMGQGQSDMSQLYQAAYVLAKRERYSNSAIDQAWERFREKCNFFAKRDVCLSEDGGPPSSDAALRRRHGFSKQQWLRMLWAAAIFSTMLFLISSAAAAGSCGFWRGIVAWWTDESVETVPEQISRVERDKITAPEESGDYADF